MKCPKCGFTSFPYLESCRQCGLGLDEPRAALGLYALRPDPPDLLLAYQTARLDGSQATPVPAASISSLDLSFVEEIEPEITESQAIAFSLDQSEEPVSSAPDMLPTLNQEISTAAELPTLEPRTEASESADDIVPHTFDLRESADTLLELDHTVNRDGPSAQSSQSAPDSPDETPVYDLDLDDDLDGLSLRPIANESSPESAADGEAEPEYTLEIEDNLEFEIKALELEQDDSTEDADDDKP
jgi:hypothetical protein